MLFFGRPPPPPCAPSRALLGGVGLLRGAAPGWLFLLLLASERLCAAFALSTCKTTDLEMVKRKRIEAIRGQILSKLRLTSPPDVEVEAEAPVSDELMALYNSSVATIRDGADEEPETPQEDYYAKEVHRFNMLPASDAVYENEYKKTSYDIFFAFNITTILNTLSDPDLLYRAELRMMRSAGSNQEQRVELYQQQRDSGNNSSWYYLDGRTVKVTAEKQWLSFDITTVLRVWLGGKETLGRFRLNAHCSCGSAREALKVDIEATKGKRGDRQLLINAQQQPYLLVMAIPPERLSQMQSHRSKRGVGEDYCKQQPGEKNCCVRPLFINFREDLNWKWIHKPAGYYANYCSGDCPYLWSMNVQHSKVVSLYRQTNPSASATPCCTPEKLESLTIMYYRGRQTKVEELTNMVVKSCKCS